MSQRWWSVLIVPRASPVLPNAGKVNYLLDQQRVDRLLEGSLARVDLGRPVPCLGASCHSGTGLGLCAAHRRLRRGQHSVVLAHKRIVERGSWQRHEEEVQDVLRETVRVTDAGRFLSAGRGALFS
jgi:hypothetical protein